MPRPLKHAPYRRLGAAATPAAGKVLPGRRRKSTTQRDVIAVVARGRREHVAGVFSPRGIDVRVWEFHRRGVDKTRLV